MKIIIPVILALTVNIVCGMDVVSPTNTNLNIRVYSDPYLKIGNIKDGKFVEDASTARIFLIDPVFISDTADGLPTYPNSPEPINMNRIQEFKQALTKPIQQQVPPVMHIASAKSKATVKWPFLLGQTDKKIGQSFWVLTYVRSLYSPVSVRAYTESKNSLGQSKLSLVHSFMLPGYNALGQRSIIPYYNVMNPFALGSFKEISFLFTVDRGFEGGYFELESTGPLAVDFMSVTFSKSNLPPAKAVFADPATMQKLKSEKRTLKISYPKLPISRE